MKLFTNIQQASKLLEELDSDLDPIDCLDYQIIKLEEKTANESKDYLWEKDELKTESSMGHRISRDEWERRLGIWRTLLVKLRKLRDELYTANLDKCHGRPAVSWPEGNRLRFPVCTSKVTLLRKIRLLNEICPHKTPEFLVWHL